MAIRDSFPAGVAGQLKWYVYRLIDPRNGETFYIGKGRGNRVFDHVKGEIMGADTPEMDDAEDATDLKLQRIKEIRAAGLEVGHIVHRHGIEQESVAYEVEAALIDAYPGLSNKAGGHGSGDYGQRHVEEIIAEYAAEPFEVGEPLILISIGQSFLDEALDIYHAVRSSWKISPARVQDRRLVLAHYRGKVVGAFRPAQWLEATEENFPGRSAPGRWGFCGEPAEAAVQDRYVGKRVPEEYRRKGAANPVRYCDP